MRIDSAPFEKLHSWHNLGYNGHPDFWFHVDKVIQAKYPSDNPQFKYQAAKVFSMKFCTITPTRGDRPQFLEFCKHQLSRMYVKPDHSYFIDFPPESTDFDLVGRVRKGVEQAKADGFDRVFIVEDDDFYPADYFLHVPQDADFIGDDHTIYYHLGNRTWQEWSHPRRASLFTTGFRIPSIQDFQWIPDNERFLDISLWNYAVREKKTVFWRQSKAIGIKHGIGLCGGRGHIQRNKYQDQDLSWLKAHVDTEAFTFYSTLKLK